MILIFSSKLINAILIVAFEGAGKSKSYTVVIENVADEKCTTYKQLRIDSELLDTEDVDEFMSHLEDMDDAMLSRIKVHINEEILSLTKTTKTIMIRPGNSSMSIIILMWMMRVR